MNIHPFFRTLLRLVLPDLKSRAGNDYRIRCKSCATVLMVPIEPEFTGTVEPVCSTCNEVNPIYVFPKPTASGSNESCS